MTMRRRALLTTVLAASVLLVACGESVPPLAPIEAGQTVLAFGDSVTHGTGAAAGEDWPTRLALQTGWRVINAGLPGDTAQAGARRLPALLEAHRPALLLIEMGGNDFLRRREARLVKEDLRQLVQQGRQAGAQVVLVAVPALSLFGVVAGRVSDAPIYAELAEEEGVPVVADVFAEVLNQPALCADKIHPNAAGYRVMADGIRAHLQATGLVRHP